MYLFLCFRMVHGVHESLLAPFAKLKSLFLLDCARLAILMESEFHVFTWYFKNKLTQMNKEDP